MDDRKAPLILKIRGAFSWSGCPQRDLDVSTYRVGLLHE